MWALIGSYPKVLLPYFLFSIFKFCLIESILGFCKFKVFYIYCLKNLILNFILLIYNEDIYCFFIYIVKITPQYWIIVISDFKRNNLRNSIREILLKIDNFWKLVLELI
jgi:hypothetical protein